MMELVWSPSTLPLPLHSEPNVLDESQGLLQEGALSRYSAPQPLRPPTHSTTATTSVCVPFVRQCWGGRGVLLVNHSSRIQKTPWAKPRLLASSPPLLPLPLPLSFCGCSVMSLSPLSHPPSSELDTQGQDPSHTQPLSLPVQLRPNHHFVVNCGYLFSFPVVIPSTTSACRPIRRHGVPISCLSSFQLIKLAVQLWTCQSVGDRGNWGDA